MRREGEDRFLVCRTLLETDAARDDGPEDLLAETSLRWIPVAGAEDGRLFWKGDTHAQNLEGRFARGAVLFKGLRGVFRPPGGEEGGLDRTNKVGRATRGVHGNRSSRGG